MAAIFVAMGVSAAYAEGEVEPRPVVVAGLPAVGPDTAAMPAPFTPVQQQTCGCTAAPNRKQKIMVNSGGRSVCTVTQMACWAP
jgi:hypothetical protein